MNLSPRLLLLLPGWIAFMVYLPALGNGFVWDDTYFITDLPYLRDPTLWWQHIREPLFVSRNYFRPLPLLTFVAEAQIGGINAFVFHLSNLLLHALNTTLVVLLARVLLKDRADSRQANFAAASAGLLFGLHPALIESVCWISDRFDLLMGTFIFLALWCDAVILSAVRKASTVSLLFLLALLCKETSVIFLALLPLWQLTRQTSELGWRDHLRNLLSPSALLIWIGLALAMMAYLALRHDALGVFYRSDTLIVPGNTLQHALLMAKTLGWYALLVLWPFGQIGPVHPGSTPIAMNDAWAWLSVAALLALGSGIGLLLRRPKARSPTIGLLILAALVALAPVSNVVPLTIADNMVHDRYLLLPLAFIALALAVAIPSLPASLRRVRWVAAGAWVALSAGAVFLTVPHWESNLTLWGWAYSSHPHSNIARGNHMAALANAGQHQAVLELCDEILHDYPDNAVAMHDKALALMRLNRDAEARRYSEMSLQYFSRNDAKGRLDLSEAHNLLGFLSMRAGDWSAAENSLNEAIRLTPYLTRPHFNLAMVHYERGDIEAGDREMEFTLRYDPPELLPVHKSQADKKRLEATSIRPGSK